MRILCFILLAAALAAQEQTGSITGVVRDSISQLPVKKATVTVNQQQTDFRQSPVTRSVTTDASGSFTISNLPAGNYVLQTQNENYPQDSSGQAHKKVEIKAGATGERIALELVPGAAVTGRVLDEDGDPLSGCMVQLRSAKRMNQGVPQRGSGATNEDGEYRRYNIPAGKYILLAQCSSPVFQARPFSAGPDPPPSAAYPTQYYPLASEAKSAQAIELLPGSEKSRLDFRLKPAAVTQVRGSFSPAGADWHGRDDIQPQLFPVDPSAPRQFDMGENFELATGTFEFRKVFPGSYILLVASRRQDDNAVGAVQRIEIKDKPVDTVIELHRAMDLSGTVAIESKGNDKVPPNQIFIQLIPAHSGMNQSQVQVQEDGSFTFKSVLPGLWNLHLNGPNAYLKSARFGNDDVTERPIDLSSGVAGPLALVAGTNTATVRGTAPAGQFVFIEHISDQSEYLNRRVVQVDPNGHYTLEGMAPGKYRIVSSETGGSVPEDGGREITLHEGETLDVDIKGEG